VTATPNRAERIAKLEKDRDREQRVIDVIDAAMQADPSLGADPDGLLRARKAKALAKLAEVKKKLSDLKDAAKVEEIERELQAAAVKMLETFGGDPKQFEGTATILASANDTLITQPNMLPTIFTGRPWAEACNDWSHVRFLFQHDQNIPLGPIDKLWEDDRGLWAKVSFSKTPKGAEIAQLCRDGALCEASVGFNVKAARTEKREGIGLVRVVTKAELLDISVVSWGANPAARITEAASKGGSVEYANARWRADLQEAEAQLRRLNGDFSPTLETNIGHFDWIRGRELSYAEHEAQQDARRAEQLRRAIQRDPSIAKMETSALIAYVEAISS